jgi:hypothetical protein
VRALLHPIIFLIALLCSACVAPHTPLDPTNLHRTIYIEKSFTPIEENYIEEAAKEWECATDGMIKVEVIRHFSIPDYPFIQDPRHAIIFVKSNSNASIIKDSDKELPQSPTRVIMTVGLYDPGSGAIPDQIFLVENMLTPYDYQAVATHELGHAFGLHHDKSTNAVMYAHIDRGSYHITNNDLTQLCSVYNCKDANIHTCP